MQDPEEHQVLQTRLFQVRDELIWGGGDPFSSNATVGAVGDNILQEAFWKVKRFREDRGENGEECRDEWIPEPVKHFIT